MAALGGILKKAAGVVTSLGSVAAKAAGLTVVSSALSSVSNKLLASPAPMKESAAALENNLPKLASTPMKASSLAVQFSSPQASIPPVPSTPIKANSYELTGQSPPAPENVQPVIMPSAVTTSYLSATEPEAPKTAAKILDELKTPGERKQEVGTLAIIVGAVVFVVIAIIAVFAKRRRK